MVPGGGLPAGHLALLYDQSLRKELGPWNKADKIGRQWRCCSLSWRLLSPRVWGMWRERTVGVWPEVRAVWAPAASLLTRFLKTTTLYGFKMPTPGKRRTDKDEEGRSFTPRPGFLATVKRDTCFIWTMKGNVYLSLHPSYCRHSAAFDDCCLLFTLIFIIINQASCPYPPLKPHS